MDLPVGISAIFKECARFAAGTNSPDVKKAGSYWAPQNKSSLCLEVNLSTLLHHPPIAVVVIVKGF